jgi:hypothetical protein
MANKSIYEFTVNKKVKKEVTEETEQGKLTKTIETEVPVKIVLKQPSRVEANEARMVYALEYGEGVRKGLLTNAIIERTYDKDGYIKEQQARALEIGRKLVDLQNEFKFLSSLEEKSADHDVKVKSIEDDWYTLQNDLQAIKNSMANLYNSTAETFADQKVMLWLTLFLTYIEEQEGQPKPFFKGEADSFEEKFKKKLAHFDALSELDDEFINAVMDKAGVYISLWHLRKAVTKEDFDAIEAGLKEEIENEEADNAVEPEKEEEVKEESPAQETVVE